MATATMTYTGPADGAPSATLSHVGTVPDTLMSYFFAFYRTVYGNYFDNVLQNMTHSATDSVGKDNAVATDAQVYEEYCQGVANGTAANVQRFVEEQAKSAALAQVQSIIVTQTK